MCYVADIRTQALLVRHTDPQKGDLAVWCTDLKLPERTLARIACQNRRLLLVQYHSLSGQLELGPAEEKNSPQYARFNQWTVQWQVWDMREGKSTVVSALTGWMHGTSTRARGQGSRGRVREELGASIGRSVAVGPGHGGGGGAQGAAAAGRGESRAGGDGRAPAGWSGGVLEAEAIGQGQLVGLDAAGGLDATRPVQTVDAYVRAV